MRRKRIKINVPGYTPDWSSILQGDPTYHNFVVGQQGEHATGLAGRNTGFFNKLLEYGALPPGTDLSGFELTPEQMQAIQANASTGTSGQLSQLHNRNVQGIQDSLASRGIMRSGALGVGLGQEQTDDSRRRTEALSLLLGKIAELQAEFAGAEKGRYDALYGPQGMAETTQNRLVTSGLYKERPASTIRAHRVKGTNLYVDASGNYYDQNGNPTDRYGASKKIRGQVAPPIYNPGYRP